MKNFSKVFCCSVSMAMVIGSFAPAALAAEGDAQQQQVKPLTSNVQNVVLESLSQAFINAPAHTSATSPRIKPTSEDDGLVASLNTVPEDSVPDEEVIISTEEEVTDFVNRGSAGVPENEGDNPDVEKDPNTISSTKLDFGTESSEVKLLQQRLMQLEYMEHSNPTGYYGHTTQDAIQYFQRANGISIDGVAGRATLDLLFSGNARAYVINPGDQGLDVKSMQKRLNELEYYYNAFNGNYGSQTQEAVKAFQQANGLIGDGKVGIKTRDLLYSANPVKGPGLPEPEPEPEPTKSTGNNASNGSSGSSGGNKNSSNSGSNGSSNGGDTATPTGDNDDAIVDTGSSSDDDVQGDISTGSNSEATPKPTATAKPSSTPKPSAGNSGSEDISTGGGNSSSTTAKGVSGFMDTAYAQSGKKYVLGGNGPNVFDCSGFVYYCLKQSGVSVGRLSAAGYYSCGWKKVSSQGDLKTGDLIFFTKDGGSAIGHVGIYCGGGKMIHASTSEGKILTTNLSMAYWQRNYAGARRVF